MKKSTLAFALTLLSITSAFAANADICKPRKVDAVQKIVLFTPDASCEAAQDMAAVLQSVQDQFGVPAPVTMVMEPRYDNASFDDGHMIEIPVQFVHETRFGKSAYGDLAQLEVIVIHEYGHAILSQILKKNFAEEFKSIFAELERISAYRENSIIKENKSPKVTYNFGDEKAYERYAQIMVPYSELFADTIAVYSLNEPGAMVRALYFDDLSRQEYNYIKLRDFSVEHTLKDLENYTDPHSKMSITRSYIGKNLMPKNAEEKIKYFNILQKSIIAAIRLDLAKKDIPTLEQANTQLIDLIEQNLVGLK